MFEIALEKMTTKEKLVVLERIWEDLARNPNDIPSPAWHENVLNTRAGRVANGRTDYIDWADAKQLITDKTK